MNRRPEPPGPLLPGVLAQLVTAHVETNGVAPMHADLVYRTRQGRMWHWPSAHDPAAAGCTGAALDPAQPAVAVSVPMGDRCTGRGCGQRWTAWLRRTLVAALADEAARLRAAS